MNKEINNPWAGTSSYQDPETSGERLKFCGRDNESYDVANLIDNNIFVTLYGKSGTGKTSLINAGVFPRLRKSAYCPISIRLGMEAIDSSFPKCIIARIEDIIGRKGHSETIDAVPLPSDESTTEFLWAYFARSRFFDQNNHVIFPVIVFDQFEEVLRNRRKDVEILLRQIYFMMDETHALSDRVIGGQLYTYDFNFRFIVSIREDDLYRLEDCIDNNYLQNMKYCRYRLRNFTDQGARDVIFIPGNGLFHEDEKDKIADTIIDIARNEEDQSVSANILSLICNRIFVELQKEGADKINFSLVEKFIKGNPFERFYNEATRGLSNREKAYIETHLVDSAGRRNSVAESDFLLNVRNGSVLFEGERKILQRISTSSDGSNYRIELIHDTFCEPLAGLKEKRERKKRMKWIASGIALALSAIGIIAFLTYQQMENTRLIKENKTTIAKNVKLNERLIEENHQKNKTINQNKILMTQKDSINDKNKQLIFILETTNHDLKDKNRQLEYEKKASLAKSMRIHKLEQDSINTAEQLESLNGYVNGTFPKDNPTDVDDSTMIQDDILFDTSTPSTEEIDNWKLKYFDLCFTRIQTMGTGYNIPNEMINNDPCLVYLVLTSKTLNDSNETQNWFDMYNIMNQEQINKLYNILYREKYKLAQIEKKYQDKQKQINEKYRENNGEHGVSESVQPNVTNPDNLNELAYVEARKKNWSTALHSIDLAIELNPDEANYYDSKGEILLMKGDEKAAVKMWNKVMEIDPDFLSKHNGTTPLYQQLLERGVINK